MALGDLVQKGTQWKVGFGAFVYTGFQPDGDGVSYANPADTDEIKGEQNETVSLIITNPRSTLSLNLMIKETGGTVTPFSDGDYVSVTEPDGVSAVKYRVVSSSWTFGPKITKCTCSLIREDSMQTTYDA